MKQINENKREKKTKARTYQFVRVCAHRVNDRECGIRLLQKIRLLHTRQNGVCLTELFNHRNGSVEIGLEIIKS